MSEQLFKTELEALIACRNHWQFMEISGSDSKSSYNPAKGWDNNCACCSFVGLHNRIKTIDGCNLCPLSGYAWGQASYNCDMDGSYFRKWAISSTIEQRRFWANRMIYACNQAIENYLLNKEN